MAVKSAPTDPKEEMKENIIALGVVLLIVVGAVWWVFTRLNAPATVEDARYAMPVGISPVLGSADAPLTVVVFSDFECPFCATFALKEFPSIRERYVDTGQVRFVFKHFPLESHARALPAAQAASCVQKLAGDDGFWQYHDLLFANQDALSDDDLARSATDVGVDAAAFSQCVADGPLQVGDEKLQGREAGVVGTPTFFFNGRKVIGFLTVEQFAVEAEKELQ